MENANLDAPCIGDNLLELVQYTPAGKPQGDNKAGDTGSVHVCFVTDAIDDLHQKLVAYGGRLHCEPQEVGLARVMYFRDPDGVILEAIGGQPPL